MEDNKKIAIKRKQFLVSFLQNKGIDQILNMLATTFNKVITKLSKTLGTSDQEGKLVIYKPLIFCNMSSPFLSDNIFCMVNMYFPA